MTQRDARLSGALPPLLLFVCMCVSAFPCIQKVRIYMYPRIYICKSTDRNWKSSHVCESLHWGNRLSNGLSKSHLPPWEQFWLTQVQPKTHWEVIFKAFMRDDTWAQLVFHSIQYVYCGVEEGKHTKEVASIIYISERHVCEILSSLYKKKTKQTKSLCFCQIVCQMLAMLMNCSSPEEQQQLQQLSYFFSYQFLMFYYTFKTIWNTIWHNSMNKIFMLTLTIGCHVAYCSIWSFT